MHQRVPEFAGSLLEDPIDARTMRRPRRIGAGRKLAVPKNVGQQPLDVVEVSNIDANVTIKGSWSMTGQLKHHDS
ncbi:MAG: hypothetical protein LC808_13095, partial [Actinobacteria bacterium]|nr:hypothetical protein [Actinomycetota bacterium]